MHKSEDTTRKGQSIRTYKPSTRATHQVDWPGTKDGEKPVTLLYLSCAETQESYFEARKHFDRKGQPIDEAAEGDFRLEIDYQMLKRAMLEPGAESPDSPMFHTVEQLRANLSPTEAHWILDEYRRIQNAECAAWSEVNADHNWRRLADLLELDRGLPAAELLFIVEGKLRKLAELEGADQCQSE